MKKLLLSTFALLGMAGMAFAGTGTQTDPYTVDEVVQMYKANNSIDVADVYVKGYIVGSMADANNTNLSTMTFGASPASNTNLVLAGFAAEDDYQYCLAVQLPNTSVRTALSLQQNPNNIYHQVLLKGRINKYCSGAGLRDTSEYEWIGEAPVPGTGGGSSENYAKGSPDAPLSVGEFLAMGTPSPAVTGTYLTGYIVGFVDSNDNNTFKFSATDCTVPSNIVLAATAGETEKANSVPVQLPAGDVRAALNLVDHPDNIGKQVTLYGSHEAYFSLNGFKSVTHYWWGDKGEVVTDQPGGDNPGNGDAPTGVITVANALQYISNGGTGTIQVKGYITRITTKEENFAQYHDMDYYIADEKNGTPELYIYNGNYFNGADFTSMDQIKTGDLVVVEGKGTIYDGVSELARGSKIISINGESGSGETPSQPGVVNPDDFNGTVQIFDKGLGFPEGSSAAPTTPTSYTATDTNITYEIMGCYVNSGYILLNGKNYEGAFISWTLPNEMKTLLMTTSSGCSTNSNSKVNVYANDNIIIENLAVNSVNTTYAIEIPEAYQAVGTVYKVESATKSYNQQFASFKYSSTVNGVEEILAADDSKAVYYNLQGQRVNNPERGIFVKVVNGKAIKVVK